MTPPALELRGIEKRFGSVQALRGADFVVGAGEVHALLGENGAGKTTLMDVAFGLIRPDAGLIRMQGAVQLIDSPRRARALGIGMVHQHFTSIPALTVAENVALGSGLGIGRRVATPEPGTVLSRLWTGLDPEALVESLPVGLRQRLEIVKALAANARILLLDEPTAVLTPPEVAELLGTIRRFAAAGGAVVLITHKLDEVFAVADRVTVLRHGEVTLAAVLGVVSKDRVAAAMLGHRPERDFGQAQERPTPGDVLVEAWGIRVDPEAGVGRGPGLVEGDLTLRAGEIVGVAAVEGNGHRELLHAVAGLRRSAGGTFEVRGQVALVPEDRSTEGLIPGLTVVENVALGLGRAAPWVRRPWLDWPAARARTRELMATFDVRAPGPDARTVTLSGGNQQKLVMARALEAGPAVLVAENPTRGLDLAATAAVHRHLRDAAARGVGVLLYSADLDEVLELSDRVVVVARGRTIAVPPRADRETIGRLMLSGPSEPRP